MPIVHVIICLPSGDYGTFDGAHDHHATPTSLFVEEPFSFC
jgi:hypothetical protein